MILETSGCVVPKNRSGIEYIVVICRDRTGAFFCAEPHRPVIFYNQTQSSRKKLKRLGMDKRNFLMQIRNVDDEIGKSQVKDTDKQLRVICKAYDAIEEYVFLC